MTRQLFTIALLLTALVAYQPAYAQNVRNTYRFYNSLSTTEPDCAEDLVPAKGLNLLCQASTASTMGQFITDTLSRSGTVRTVYHNNQNWGLRYANATGVIGKTYTVQVYLKVTNFNQFYTRLIDFSNGVEDDGIYFTNFNTPAPTSNRCFNFYPNGNFGVCPFFNNSTYYFLTITRNDATKLIDIYVNNQLFTSYNDAAGFYVGAAGRPIHIFRDDPVGFACEDGEANFAYLSFANYYSRQSDVNAIYQNLDAVVNTVDFSIAPTTVCKGAPVAISYAGNIPANANQYNYNWDWNGGQVVSGTGRGPFLIQWNMEGTKTVSLNITGGGCGSVLSNSRQVTVNPAVHSQTDTSICPGSSYEGYTIAGTYTDTFTRPLACDSIRTVRLKITAAPMPNLGPAQVLCPGDVIVLSPGNFQSYRWQDGSTQSSFTVTKAGLYEVTVANACTTAKAELQVTESPCDIYFPGAFTPNKDGKNETFKVLSAGAFASYNLSVYNRYGQKVFETKQATAGWDGRINGKDAGTGAYVWHCTFSRNVQKVQSLKGTVMLLR